MIETVPEQTPMLTPRLSLVVPTRNERANIEPLVAEIRAALAGLPWELVVVDDSTDGTDALVARLAAADPAIRLLHRTENTGGLAGAVVAGFALARGDYVCVLDGDLQHPPARIPALLAEAERTGADIVIASRYRPGGSAGGLAGPLRRFYSWGLKELTRACFPRRLAGITDPLGGFFLVRRIVLEGVALRPVGYKILLEVLVRCPWRRVAEVPYRFRPRRAGSTKADLRQGLRFLRHLGILLWDCSPALAPLHPLIRRSR